MDWWDFGKNLHQSKPLTRMDKSSNSNHFKVQIHLKIYTPQIQILTNKGKESLKHHQNHKLININSQFNKNYLEKK